MSQLPGSGFVSSTDALLAAGNLRATPMHHRYQQECHTLTAPRSMHPELTCFAVQSEAILEHKVCNSLPLPHFKDHSGKPVAESDLRALAAKWTSKAADQRCCTALRAASALCTSEYDSLSTLRCLSCTLEPEHGSALCTALLSHLDTLVRPAIILMLIVSGARDGPVCTNKPLKPQLTRATGPCRSPESMRHRWLVPGTLMLWHLRSELLCEMLPMEAAICTAGRTPPADLFQACFANARSFGCRRGTACGWVTGGIFLAGLAWHVQIKVQQGTQSCFMQAQRLSKVIGHLHVTNAHWASGASAGNMHRACSAGCLCPGVVWLAGWTAKAC